MTSITTIRRRRFLSGVIALSLISSLPTYAASPSKTQSNKQKALVIVSLADNQYQGIVPIKPILGNGQDPKNNLYWGAMYGVRSYFKRHDDYLVKTNLRGFEKPVLDKITITPKHTTRFNVDAIAIDGQNQNKAVQYFLENITTSREYDLVIFMGHNALMDTDSPILPERTKGKTGSSAPQKAAVIACQSKRYFNPIVEFRRQ